MRAALGIPAVGSGVAPATAAPADAPGSDAARSDGTPRQFGASSTLRRPFISRRVPVLASSVLAAVLLAGCAGEAAGTVPSSAASASSTSAEPSAPAPSEPADPTDDGAVDESPVDESPVDESPTDDGSGGGSSSSQDPSDDGSDGGSPDGGTEGLPGWPVEATPMHGSRYWAAYLAVGAPGDPALQQVLEDVQESWPGAGLGELGCDQGAAEALGRDRAEHAVAVYFPTQQHITEFRRRWDAPFVGAVQVTTFCGD